MSILSTVFEDSSNGEMTLKFLMDGIEKTKYKYTADGYVTLSARTESHVNSYLSFFEGIKLVSEWVKKILSVHRMSLKEDSANSITRYSLGSQYLTNGTIKCVFKIGKTRVINTRYNVESKNISFSKRSEVKMCFKDFLNLLNYQKYFCSLIKLLIESDHHINNDLDDEI